MFGGSADAIRADPRVGRFLGWITNKDPHFPRAHASAPLTSLSRCREKTNNRNRLLSGVV
jgi:hypothetical protein